jgi:hypothetical protein
MRGRNDVGADVGLTWTERARADFFRAAVLVVMAAHGPVEDPDRLEHGPSPAESSVTAARAATDGGGAAPHDCAGVASGSADPLLGGGCWPMNFLLAKRG